MLAAHEHHIGGIVSSGLTNADIGKHQAVGGLFYEFTRRVVKYYQDFDRDRPDAQNVKLCRTVTAAPVRPFVRQQGARRHRQDCSA